MKYIKASVLVMSFFLFTGCVNKQQSVAEKVENQVPKQAEIRNVVLNIEGMTCEIGCAKLIESKLAKTKGIEKVEVKFEDKRGLVRYDASQISEKEMVSVVEKIAGGDLYKVLNVKKAE